MSGKAEARMNMDGRKAYPEFLQSKFETDIASSILNLGRLSDQEYVP